MKVGSRLLLIMLLITLVSQLAMPINSFASKAHGSYKEYPTSGTCYVCNRTSSGRKVGCSPDKYDEKFNQQCSTYTWCKYKQLRRWSCAQGQHPGSSTCHSDRVLYNIHGAVHDCGKTVYCFYI